MNTPANTLARAMELLDRQWEQDAGKLYDGFYAMAVAAGYRTASTYIMAECEKLFQMVEGGNQPADTAPRLAMLVAIAPYIMELEKQLDLEEVAA